MNEPIAKVTVSREGGGWPPVLGSRIVTDTAILQAFGATMIHWSFGEAVVEDLIAGLLGVPPVHAYSLTANINISSRCHSIRALARQCLVASDFSEFDSALANLKR
jgi:hypothetical protein